MSTFDDLWPVVEPIAAGIAAEYGRRHRVHGADESDFRQEFALWLVENSAQVADWHAELDKQGFERMVARVLRNEGTDYGLDIKAHAVGYKREDLYFYSKGEVKALLPLMFDPEKWHEPPQSEGRSTKSQAEGGGWIATLADISQAFDRLETEDRELLAAFHKDEWSNVLMAEAYGVTEQVMSYRHDRAVRRLLKVLGDTSPRPMRAQTNRDPWRGRRAIPAPAMRAYEQKAYDGE